MAKGCVLVCKSCKGSKALAACLADQGVAVERVRCQKICHGPVVGARVGGRLEWFERVAKPKAQRALARLAETRTDVGDLPDRLARRRVAKRSGCKPR